MLALLLLLVPAPADPPSRLHRPALDFATLALDHAQRLEGQVVRVRVVVGPGPYHFQGRTVFGVEGAADDVERTVILRGEVVVFEGEIIQVEGTLRVKGEGVFLDGRRVP